ncbi:hypothetical protein ACOSP7_021046 [Xanthoceras sorbifolium]
MMTIQALVHVLNEFMVVIRSNRIERPLTRPPIATSRYNYIHKVLHGDPNIFRQLYWMYTDVFRKLCSIITEKALIQDARFICVEEMLGTFLLFVCQNSHYCQTRDTIGRSHFSASKNFNKILKALNIIAPELMAKPSPTVPAKIRESTRFYPHIL